MKPNELLQEYAEAAIEANKTLLPILSVDIKAYPKIVIQEKKISDVINASLGEENSFVPLGVQQADTEKTHPEYSGTPLKLCLQSLS